MKRNCTSLCCTHLLLENILWWLFLKDPTPTQFLHNDVFKSQTVKFVLHSLSHSFDHSINSSLLYPHLWEWVAVSFIFLIQHILICWVFISVHKSAIFQTFVIFISSSPFFYLPTHSLPLPASHPPSRNTFLHFISIHLAGVPITAELCLPSRKTTRVKILHTGWKVSRLCFQTRCLQAQSRPMHWRVHYGTLLSQLMSLHT